MTKKLNKLWVCIEKHWPTLEYTILFISIIPLPALIGYHVQPGEIRFKSRPIWADWIPVVILVFIFACCPWNPISTILSFNKSSVSVSSIISWVLGAHSVKRNKCFVYLNQLKQLCVESLPSWITVYAFAITYICRVSLIINHELVWLSKLRQNGGKKRSTYCICQIRGAKTWLLSLALGF